MSRFRLDAYDQLVVGDLRKALRKGDTALLDQSLNSILGSISTNADSSKAWSVALSTHVGMSSPVFDEDGAASVIQSRIRGRMARRDRQNKANSTKAPSSALVVAARKSTPEELLGRIDRVQDEVRGITVAAMVAQRKIHHEGDGSRWGAVRKHV